VHHHQGNTFSPNDRLFRIQWNFRLIGASRTWAIQKGSAEVAVAVLDTGVAYEDFGAFRKAPDWGSVRFLQGIDAVNGDSHANDDELHGTHVASTVAEATNNELQVAGLAFGCSIMPVKVLDALGRGTNFEVAEGLDYVTNFREGGANPVKVINMSFGGGGTSETIRRAIDRASQAGILLVGSAGNDGNGTVEFPANLDNVVAVGALDGSKQRARYSNYGSALDLVAPGGDSRRDDDGDGIPDFIFQQTYDPDLALLGQYDQFVTLGIIGTSSAAPHVSALAALLFSQGIGDARAVRAAMEQTATDLGTAGRDDQFGHGLIDPAKALSGVGLNQ
jgi:serine protease